MYIYIYIYIYILTIHVHKDRSESNISYIIYTTATEKRKQNVLIKKKFFAKQKLPSSSVEAKFWKQKN